MPRRPDVQGLLKVPEGFLHSVRRLTEVFI